MKQTEAAGLPAMLLGHARALADEYGRFLQQEERPAPAGGSNQPQLETKDFQARHAAAKAALAHLELLLRIARSFGGDQELAGESDEDLEAEAARNLARPA